MASVVLRLFTNIYSYFVVYVLTASWLGSLGVVYLPFRLSLDTALGLLILSAFSLHRLPENIESCISQTELVL